MDTYKEGNGKPVIIQGLDIMDVVGFINKKNKTFQAMFLSDLETVLKENSTTYKFIRKIFLDTMNNYTRSLLRVIFGNIEEDDGKDNRPKHGTI